MPRPHPRHGGFGGTHLLGEGGDVRDWAPPGWHWEVGSGRSNLGRIVLANGRFAIGERLKPLLEAAREAGLLHFDSTETAFRTFFGLVGRDVQIRLLLGDTLKLTETEIAGDARRATQQFFQLHKPEKRRRRATNEFNHGKET